MTEVLSGEWIPKREFTTKRKSFLQKLEEVDKELANNPLVALMEGEESRYDIPHEKLVGFIKGVLTQARADYENEGLEFDPVVWIGKRLTSRTIRSERGFIHKRPKLGVSLSYAWDAISEPYIKSQDYRRIIKYILRSETASAGSNLVTLEPGAVKFLDAMAEAVDIPYTRGVATFDLLKNIR